MNREQQTEDFISHHMPQVSFLNEDPHMKEIMKRYVYGDVYGHGSLSFIVREYITLAVLTTIQGKELIIDHVLALLKEQVSPEVIKEVLYHCIPYAGIVRVHEALQYLHKALPTSDSEIDHMASVVEDTRFTKGFDVQSEAFGREAMQHNHDVAPTELKHIQVFLSEHCFGDFYTRKGLDLKERELLTFCIIASLGGCENQLRGHANGNVKVGNTRDMLIEAITQCQPYIGFPRTLNAINIINEVVQ